MGGGKSDPDTPVSPGPCPQTPPCSHGTHERAAETVKCRVGSSPVQPAYTRVDVAQGATHTHGRGPSCGRLQRQQRMSSAPCGHDGLGLHPLPDTPAGYGVFRDVPEALGCVMD